MDLCADGLEVVCKHLDTHSIVRLAGTDKETRNQLLALQIRVYDPIPFGHPSSSVLHFCQRIIQTGREVYCAAWCPQSRRIVYGLHDGYVVLFDCAAGTQIFAIKAHFCAVWSVHWSPDGLQVMSSSGDGTLRVWNADTGAQRQEMQTPYKLKCVEWSPDATKLVTGSSCRWLHIWDAITGRRLHVFEGHASDVTCVGWSPDSTKVVSGSCDKTVRIWNAITGEALAVWKGHLQMVRCVAWCSNGLTIASCADDKTVRVWDAFTGKAIHVLQNKKSIVDALCWSPDGLKLATAYDHKTMSIWDAHTWQQVQSCSTEHTWSVAWSPDGTKIVSTTSKGTVCVWNVA